MQEVEQLKQELELCQMQLCAKYKATKILQQQVMSRSANTKDLLRNKPVDAFSSFTL